MRCTAGLVQCGALEHLSFVLGLQSLIPCVRYWPNVQLRAA